MSMNRSCRRAGMLCLSSLSAAVLVACGGGGSSGSIDVAVSSADVSKSVALAAPVNSTPLLTWFDTAGIGSAVLVSDLPTLPTTNPPNDTSVTITSVTTGTTGGVPYCLVKLLVKPAINIWVGLPTGGKWNGRLQSEGGGGYAGSVGIPTGSIAAGYIGVQTDTGHTGGSGTFGMLTPVPNGAPERRSCRPTSPIDPST